MAVTLVQRRGPAVRSESDGLEDVIDEMRNLLNQWGLPADRIDRRCRQRFPYPHLIRITPLDHEGGPVGEPLIASGRDISLYGVGFYLPVPLPYQRAILTFDRSRGDTLSILTELEWCRFTRLGRYENGGRFLQTALLPEQIAKLIQSQHARDRS